MWKQCRKSGWWADNPLSYCIIDWAWRCMLYVSALTLHSSQFSPCMPAFYDNRGVLIWSATITYYCYIVVVFNETRESIEDIFMKLCALFWRIIYLETIRFENGVGIGFIFSGMLFSLPDCISQGRPSICEYDMAKASFKTNDIQWTWVTYQNFNDKECHAASLQQLCVSCHRHYC